MTSAYDHKNIEEKRLKVWEDSKLFQKTYDDPNITPENKLFLLFAFAYPSGEGLHVGHVESKTALDILARYNRMNGKKVFFPVGWDAFGLPAEQYAVKKGVHPSETTKTAIATFTRQIKRVGISYDWETEVNTSSPDYYKWTQWLFLELYKSGKAYRGSAHVNWCPQDQTVLANEQVVDGKCERCGTEVIQKEMVQWQYKITDYKDELISGLDKVDWPYFTKKRQIDWIGKSEGAEIDFTVKDSSEKLTVFTTRPDTIMGVTFMVVAPEHPLVSTLTTAENKSTVEEYQKKAQGKTEETRLINKEKTGVFTGSYVINPMNGKEVPVWISDYVLMGYGTGAIMAVPGHDDRDEAFAKAYGIEIIKLELDGLNGIPGTIKALEEKSVGRAKTTYRLRDWLVSRQRYWGAPIPIVYDPEGNPHMVKEEHLPWLLPTDVDFRPTGESPLTTSGEFKERVERLYGKGWRPEYDTMDTFVDSSWYFLRQTDPKNDKEFASKEHMNKLLPVDFYMIGPEHTVLHLLYSRFFTKFLRDQGYLNFDEPFMGMRHQGMILGPDNKKMSKSKGNVINPDEIVEGYGADTLRVYEMFMGPIDSDKPWDTNGVSGVRRFLSRVWNLANDAGKSNADSSAKLERLLHKSIKKVSEDIPALKFNTSISQLMIFVNEWEKEGSTLAKEDTLRFLKILAPFAPFMADELYVLGGGKQPTIHLETWAKYDTELATDESVTIVIQVNGKMRANIADIATDESELIVVAKARKAVASHLEGQEIIKVVYVPQRIVNFVVKQK
jgi:leucyl-tRNA synthetase